MTEVGKRCPNFSLLNQNNEEVKLGDFSGRWLVIYVYPKDDTPGCTLEGRAFSAAKDSFEQINTTVLGLSEDDVHSHEKFCNKFGFKISLLSDPTGAFLKSLNVEKSEYKGTFYWNRTTFLVDTNGVVRKIYKNVNPDGHEKVVLEDLKKLQAQSG